MPGCLKEVFRMMDFSPAGHFYSHDVSQWPEGCLEALMASGFLVRAANAQAAMCDGCERHCFEDVRIAALPSGETRYYIYCAEAEDIPRVEISGEALYRWALNPRGIMKFLRQSLAIDGNTKQVALNRAWKLGRVSLAGRRRDAYMLMGAALDDAGVMLQSIIEDSGDLAPLVFTGEKAFPPSEDCVASYLKLEEHIYINGNVVDLNPDTADQAFGHKMSHRKKAPKMKGCPLPRGKDFRAVKMELINDDEFQITTAGRIPEVRSFDKMGFADNRKSCPYPDRLWETLKWFAITQGVIAIKDERIPQEIKKSLPHNVRDLKPRLKCFFHTDADPFKDYNMEKAYATNFIILDARENPLGGKLPVVG